MKVGDRARDSASKFTGTIIGLDQSGVPTVIHRALLQAPAPGGVGKVGDSRAELWVEADHVELLDVQGNVITAGAESANQAAADKASGLAAAAKQKTETTGQSVKLTPEERAAADKANHDASEARIAGERTGAVHDHAAGETVEGLKLPDPNAKPLPGAQPIPGAGFGAHAAAADPGGATVK